MFWIDFSHPTTNFLFFIYPCQQGQLIQQGQAAPPNLLGVPQEHVIQPAPPNGDVPPANFEEEQLHIAREVERTRELEQAALNLYEKDKDFAFMWLCNLGTGRCPRELTGRYVRPR